VTLFQRATAIALLASWTGAAHATPPACSERLLPPSPGAATGQRPIAAKDLIELRDFGRVDDSSRKLSFSLSPDGRFAAVSLRRAHADSDSYCFGVLLVPLDGRTPMRLLDIGGEFIQAMTDPYGASGVPGGLPITDAPLWSPDGRWLAYLRRDKGRTQIWRVGLDGAPAEALARLETEPRNLAWSADGKSLLFSTRRQFDAGLVEIELEGRSGFLFDERFWSLAYARPTPRTPIATETNALDLATGQVRVVPETEAEAMNAGGAAPPPANARTFAVSTAGDRAWTASESVKRGGGLTMLHAETRGAAITCTGEICREPIAGLWWTAPGTLTILRAGSADNGGRTELYQWKVGAGSPRLVLQTDDWIQSCAPAGGGLICARETATAPRKLVRLDPATGGSTTLFDPNPEFAQVKIGKAERLRWTDKDGVRTFGDLVLPPSHRPGQRHPLIIVQYLSRGFLRGGLGDEYPIHLLAERGYAVLSFQIPPEAADAAGQASDEDAQRIKVRNWSGRRRIFTALEAGIDMTIGRGVVDPATIGITGMSDGASTVQFALNNSSRFKAAIVSTCCDEPSLAFAAGPAYGNNVVEKVGYPAAGTDGRDFWRAQSLSLNADRLHVPLLMNLPDGEFRAAQETFAALRSAGAPVEMYVFPDEWHTKWHPVHRLAIYERNTAWFDFWLRGVEVSDPARAEEIDRWRAMKRGAGSAPGSR